MTATAAAAPRRCVRLHREGKSATAAGVDAAPSAGPACSPTITIFAPTAFARVVDRAA
jgi:hypothetical protein